MPRHLITPSTDPMRALDAPACHPWMLTSPVAIYSDGTCFYRCPACRSEWVSGRHPDHLTGDRL